MSDAQPSKVTYVLGQSKVLVETMMKRTVENSAAYLKPHIWSDAGILDIGCGPGSITVGFAKLAHRGHVTGLDTSAASASLEQARVHAAAEGVLNIEFIAGDAHHLPFPDATFDIVHSHQVLQHVADPVQVLREMRRVTKPGGIVACRETDIDTFVYFPLYNGIQAYHTMFVKVVRARGMEPGAGRRLHAWAREAGFNPARIQMSTSNWTYRTPTERVAWSELCVDILEKSEYSAALVQLGFVRAEELQEMVQAWKDWRDNEDGFSVVMNMEILCRV